MTNLDDSQNLIRLSSTGADISFWIVAGRSSSPLSPPGLMLSKMLACFTRVKLLNNSTFRVTAVCAATADELEIGIDAAVLSSSG